MYLYPIHLMPFLKGGGGYIRFSFSSKVGNVLKGMVMITLIIQKDANYVRIKIA